MGRRDKGMKRFLKWIMGNDSHGDDTITKKGSGYIGELEEQMKAAVELTVEIFDTIKAKEHYAYAYMRLTAYLNTVMTLATNDTLKVQTIGALYGALFRDDKNNVLSVCASLGNQTRENNLNICRAMFEYWKSAYCQGEWGDMTGVVNAEGNPGIPGIETPAHFTAGEDIQEGDPIEIQGGKLYINSRMKP